MSLIEAIILGIVQGLTEFLPVSSSGHIEIFKVLQGVELKEALLFTVVLHLATACSTMVIYRSDIRDLIFGLFSKGKSGEKQFVLLVLVSMIPATIVGLMWEKEIEELFSGNMLLVGLMLLLTGVVLFISDRVEKEGSNEVTIKKAILTGIVQAIAILPGISRSGSTIGTAVILGIRRETAARFSFLMVLPLILGASAKKFLDYLEVSSDAVASSEQLPALVLLAGFTAAFLSGLLALQWMIKLVQRSQLKWFALYCVAAGIGACSYALFS